MTRTAVFTNGVLVGAGIVAIVWILSVTGRRLVKLWQDHRSERWTEKDATEIEAFEKYVTGYKTDTAEFERVRDTRPEPEWVRPLEEHGALIPRWRPAEVPAPPALFKGPPVWRVWSWVQWNFRGWTDLEEAWGVLKTTGRSVGVSTTGSVGTPTENGLGRQPGATPSTRTLTGAQ